jgi:cytochrome c553
MKKLTIALVAFPLAAFGGTALAGDVATGKVKADTCMDCHAGEDFEGMSTAAIADAIRAVLKGQIKHPPGMDEISEADIDDVAAYFAAEAAKE